MPKDIHCTTKTGPAELKLPEQVTVAVAELAGAAREGLLVWRSEPTCWLPQVMLTTDVAWLIGPKRRRNPDPTAWAMQQAWPGNPRRPAGADPPAPGAYR